MHDVIIVVIRVVAISDDAAPCRFILHACSLALRLTLCSCGNPFLLVLKAGQSWAVHPEFLEKKRTSHQQIKMTGRKLLQRNIGL